MHVVTKVAEHLKDSDDDKNLEVKCGLRKGIF